MAASTNDASLKLGTVGVIRTIAANRGLSFRMPVQESSGTKFF